MRPGDLGAIAGSTVVTLFRTPSLVGALVLFLGVRAVFLGWVDPDLTRAERELRALLSLALVSLPLAIYCGSLAVGSDFRRSTTILAVSGHLRWGLFLLGRAVGVASFLAAFTLVVLGADSLTLSLSVPGPGAREPRVVVGTGRVVGEEGPRGEDEILWIRPKLPRRFGFTLPDARADLAVYGRVVVRRRAGEEPLTRSVPVQPSFRIDGGVSVVGEVVRMDQAGSLRIPVPDAALRARDLELLLEIPTREGFVGIDGGRLCLIGGEVAEAVGHAQGLLRLLVIGIYLAFVSLFLTVSSTPLVGMVGAGALLALGAVRHLLLDALGAQGLETNLGSSPLLGIQVTALRWMALPSPSLVPVFASDWLRDRVCGSWWSLSGEAGGFGLYCLLFFVIAWALCRIREGR